MNWFNIRLLVLLVLVVSWHSLTEARDSDEEKVPREQKVDSAEADTKENARANTPPNIVDQIFSQPALRPSLAYQPGQSINYNIGYNLGRTIGKTPILGASLDRQADASKVVLVLANDTPETSNLPQPDGETLKRLVRTPGFWDQFASQMASFNQQLSEQVPAMSRTVGAGINEFISQTPILGDAQQTGAIDFANLGQTFGEKVLAPNLFPTTGDSNSGNADNESTQPPPSETERVENELSSNMGNPLMGNPLFQGLQSFVPQTFPTPPPLANMFQAVPAWPWMGQNQEGAASDISEVRVRPDAENPYKLSPKEGVTQKMTEMKLRAAMKDALDKKTIPILWFSLPANNEKKSTSDNTRPIKTPTPTSEEDVIMRSKLEAFEKQLISELKQLQEVVKLANAMKKAQLEAKGKKFDGTDIISPLALNNTPIYKITLADIEKTLKDEYVRKLLQMIYNSQHKDMQPKEGNLESTNTKYFTDLTGNPNKRQAASASEAMAHLNKDDMMKMMAYAYRMAAANGQEVPWQTGVEDSPNVLPMQQQSAQRQWIDSQPNMQNEQQRKSDNQQQVSVSADGEGDMSGERKHGKHRPGHGHQRPHHHGHSHGGHFPRQWVEPNSPMQQSENVGSFQGPMEATPGQRQWLESNAQMKQQPLQQTMSQQTEQRQWLEPNTQMNQQQFQQSMQAQAKQRQWLESNAQMHQQPFQQTMPQNAEQRQWVESNAQMKQQPFQQTMPEQRQWLEAKTQMKQPLAQQTEERQWLEAKTQMTQPLAQQTEERQWLEANAKMKHQQIEQSMSQQADQRHWLEPNDQMKQPSQFQGQMPMQMRQTMPMSMESQMPQQPLNDAKVSNMQMRQWVDNAGQQTPQSDPVTESKTDMGMQQQRQMLPPQMGQPAKPSEQFDPNMSMRQSPRPSETNPAHLQTQPENARQMPQNPQFQMNEQQRQMTNIAGQQQTPMANKDSQPQSQDTSSPMQRQSTDNQADPQQNAQHTGEQMPKPDERQMKAKHDQGMQISNEATPQMPENAGKERHKGLDDLFDDFDLFGHGSHKGKDKSNNRGPIINYYYNAGGSRYPPIYSSSGGYSGGYGGYAPPPAAPSYGYGGGYARPVAPPSYGGYTRPQSSPPKYASQSGYYGGGGYGSNAYGSRGGYRTATGDDEIEEMLRQHQTLPKMMLLIPTRDDNRQPPIADPNSGSPRATTSLDVPSSSSSPSADNKADLRNLAKSNQTPSASASASESSSAPASGTDKLLLTPTSASPLAMSEVASLPSASASASASTSASLSTSEDFDYSDSPQMRSMFSFDSKLLKPFMGLQKVGRTDDPWHHKPYNLYQPIFTGGGTFESLLNRYRRHVSTNPTNSPQLKHVLTPGMLDRLLRIKVNFEKNYPFLYKTMMGHLLGDKHTTLSITPPEIPDQVSYPNVELAAAEIHQLEMLVEKLKKGNIQHQHPQELQHQHQHPQQHQPVFDPSSFNQEMLAPLINSYNDENNFWDEISDSPPKPNNYWQQFQDSGEATPSIRKRESFWSEFEAAEEREKQRQQRSSHLQSADDLDNLFNIDEDFD